MRRRELLAGAAALAVSGVAGAARADGGHRLHIDTLTIDEPGFDAAAAKAAGIDAAVVDLAIYPRGPEQATEALNAWKAAADKPDARFALVRTGAELESARGAARFGVILGCQDAAILGPSVWSVGDMNLEILRYFHGLGLRVLQLTHNERNGVGDGFREKVDAGLSRLGEAVVAEMNRIGMLIDVSHCSDRTTLQAIRLSSKPIAITHAGCRALYDSRRNKTDAAVRALADRGGYFGVYMMSRWLTAKPEASAETVLDHIEHVMKVGGEDTPGFGSDQPMGGEKVPQAEKVAALAAYQKRNAGLPGAEPLVGHVTVAEMDGPDRMMVLERAMERRGWKHARIEKVMGANFRRVFAAACP
jgi:membrane dipeptidase